MQPVPAFGLIVVGDEILIGKRADKHMPHVIQVLARRGFALAWAKFVGDDRAQLAEALRLSQQDSRPVLCFGGIGATPDDQTRQAAAEAFGTGLVRHPGALRMIEDNYGPRAWPNRVFMADLPRNCLLVPNDCNGIPGFTLYEHYFFPGIPAIAWPMLEWVLDTYHANSKPVQTERSLRVYGVPESDLMPLLQMLSRHNREVRLFSLPHMGDVLSIEIGFRGDQGSVDTAFDELIAALRLRTQRFEILPEAKTSFSAGRQAI